MSQKLARKLGGGALIIYGIGDILGAGIYALVGKVIGMAGVGAWVTFLLAALLATITGLSYAEMTARFPVSAGAAAFVRRAFTGRFMATFAGIMVLGTGLASAATVTVAFSNYLQQLIPFPPFIAQCLLILGVSFLSFWGIQESSRVNLVLTIIEVTGLLAVIAVGAYLLSGATSIELPSINLAEFKFPAALAGVTIAFYAYIGFEDLANLAEECKNPQRDLPRAILVSIAVSTIIYMAVTLVLLFTVPLTEIGVSKTPLLLVFEAAHLPKVQPSFALVAILAITNTGLINLIMASRLMYGMSEEGLLPKVFGRVHAGRQTPWVGVSVAGLIVAILVFTGGLKILAQTTSLLIVLVFFLVHLSLLQVKRRSPEHGGFRIHPIFPIIGLVLCGILFTQFPVEVWLRSTLLLGIALMVWVLKKFF